MLLTAILLNFEASQSSKEMFMQDREEREQSLEVQSWFVQHRQLIPEYEPALLRDFFVVY